MRLNVLAISTLAMSFGSISYAEELVFVCQWQAVESSQYTAQFRINLDDGSVIRDGSQTNYRLVRLTEAGIWLALTEGPDLIQVLQIIERSPVGGNWTDVWLFADGTATPTVGGYCVEKSQ